MALYRAEFANISAMEVILEPGDVLYIPPFVFHFVMVVGDAVSLDKHSHGISRRQASWHDSSRPSSSALAVSYHLFFARRNLDASDLPRQNTTQGRAQSRLATGEGTQIYQPQRRGGVGFSSAARVRQMDKRDPYAGESVCA